MIVGTGPKGLEVSAAVARLIELRMEGLNLKQAAEICEIPYGTAQSWIRKYIRHQSSKAIQAMREQEAGKLEALEDKLQELFDERYNHLFQGQDTGIRNTDPNVKAGMALLKLYDRRARLFGIDKPAPKETTSGPAGEEEGPSSVMTPEQFQAAFNALSTKLNIALGPQQGVTDITPTVPRVFDDPLLMEANSE
jgi:hypothetical protein